MEHLSRRDFIIKSSRWVAGAGALYLAGTFISCSSKEQSTSAVSDQSTSTSGNDQASTTDNSQTITSENDQASTSGDQGSATIAVKVNGECIGCGRCARGICPYDAITIIGDRASIGAACVGCGRCLDVCPVDAIQPAAAV